MCYGEYMIDLEFIIQMSPHTKLAVIQATTKVASRQQSKR